MKMRSVKKFTLYYQYILHYHKMISEACPADWDMKIKSLFSCIIYFQTIAVYRHRFRFGYITLSVPA